jgi:CBS domain-containing protein
MTVKAILSRKGSEVLTIEPTATLAAAVKMLAQRRIGALVVTGPGHRIVGIISERDIVRALDANGTAVLDVPIAEVMTRKVVTCAQSETIAEIMERMTAGKFRHVPVVEQGRLAGIISIGDVVKARLEELVREQDALRDYIRTA